MSSNDESPSVEPRPLAGTEGWYVHFEWPDASFEQVGTFRTEAEAQQWIVEKSGHWLKTHRFRPERGWN
jgi:hypothetical protein